jgi:hypothetical protein
MTTPYRPPIHSQADLEEAWRHLVDPLGFRRRSLWLLLIGGDDRPTPVVTEVTDLPEVVDPETVDSLAGMLAHLQGLEPGGRWAFLLSRPGTGRSSDADRAWAAGLYDTCRRHGLAHDVVHLATDEAVLPIPLDEVTGYLRAS